MLRLWEHGTPRNIRDFGTLQYTSATDIAGVSRCNAQGGSGVAGGSRGYIPALAADVCAGRRRRQSRHITTASDTAVIVARLVALSKQPESSTLLNWKPPAASQRLSIGREQLTSFLALLESRLVRRERRLLRRFITGRHFRAASFCSGTAAEVFFTDAFEEYTE